MDYCKSPSQPNKNDQTENNKNRKEEIFSMDFKELDVSINCLRQ
jgi:hypothetical protein